MTEPISIHRYELVSRHQLNARAQRSRFSGCLIRLGESAYGYGCIHPWVELGDLDLDTTLECLKKGETTPLSARALWCADADRAARQAGVSLFDGIEVPESHATVPLDEEAFSEAAAAGFTTVKVKLGTDLEAEARRVAALADAYPELRWRFDFNHTCPAAEVEGLLNILGEGVCHRIDFMEDAWLEQEVVKDAIGGVAVAIDRHLGASESSAPYHILKPAVNDAEILLGRASGSGKKVVFTSYMDHPLGQSFAAWQAGVYARKYPGVVQRGGLITHGLFEADEFTRALGAVGPLFHSAAGTGLGFDTLLEELTWTRLV